MSQPQCFHLKPPKWIPIGMELHEVDDNGNEVPCGYQDVKPGKKTSADVIESILGLVYLHKGFSAAFAIATELGITLPRDSTYAPPTKHYKKKENLLSFVEQFLGGLTFKHPELVEEATTHPSCIHEEVPCYQRLGTFVSPFNILDPTKEHISSMIIVHRMVW